MNLNIPLNDIHSNVCKYLFSYYNTFYVRFILQKNVTRESYLYPQSHAISSPTNKTQKFIKKINAKKKSIKKDHRTHYF